MSRPRLFRPTLSLRLVDAHAALLLRGAWQVAVKAALVGTGLWGQAAVALNAFPAGLGVNLAYRPTRSIRSPAYEPLRGVGRVRGMLAAAARSAARLTGPHQRAAFRADRYLLQRRRPSADSIGDEPAAQVQARRRFIPTPDSPAARPQI